MKNWQEEYEAHFRGEALRNIRLVAGGELRALRSESGPETADGRARLKTDALREADWIWRPTKPSATTSTVSPR